MEWLREQRAAVARCSSPDDPLGEFGPAVAVEAPFKEWSSSLFWRLRYCMPYAYDVLSASAYPAVTNARATGRMPLCFAVCVCVLKLVEPGRRLHRARQAMGNRSYAPDLHIVTFSIAPRYGSLVWDVSTSKYSLWAVEDLWGLALALIRRLTSS